MKASEYIAKLQSLIEQHGDLDVWCGGLFDLQPSKGPQAAHLKTKGPRERNTKVWSTYDGESLKGPRVFLS